MQRDLPVIIGVLAFILVVAIVALSNGGGSKLSLAEKDMIPTSMILGTTTTPPPQQTEYPSTLPTVTLTITPTISMTPTVSKTPSPTPPLTTRTPTPAPEATCSSVFSKAKIQATEFMNTHKEKKAYDVLLLISEPLSQDDQDQLDFWLGTDVNNEIRLYQTTPTTYVTDSYTLGTSLSDRGDDKDIRGTTRCQMSLHEKRKTANSDGTFTIPNDELRYLDFSLTITGDLELTAFRDTRDGRKYSGFN